MRAVLPEYPNVELRQRKSSGGPIDSTHPHLGRPYGGSKYHPHYNERGGRGHHGYHSHNSSEWVDFEGRGGGHDHRGRNSFNRDRDRDRERETGMWRERDRDRERERECVGKQATSQMHADALPFVMNSLAASAADRGEDDAASPSASGKVEIEGGEGSVSALQSAWEDSGDKEEVGKDQAAEDKDKGEPTTKGSNSSSSLEAGSVIDVKIPFLPDTLDAVARASFDGDFLELSEGDRVLSAIGSQGWFPHWTVNDLDEMEEGGEDGDGEREERDKVDSESEAKCAENESKEKDEKETQEEDEREEEGAGDGKDKESTVSSVSPQKCQKQQGGEKKTPQLQENLQQENEETAKERSDSSSPSAGAGAVSVPVSSSPDASGVKPSLWTSTVDGGTSLPSSSSPSSSSFVTVDEALESLSKVKRALAAELLWLRMNSEQQTSLVVETTQLLGLMLNLQGCKETSSDPVLPPTTNPNSETCSEGPGSLGGLIPHLGGVVQPSHHPAPFNPFFLLPQQQQQPHHPMNTHHPLIPPGTGGGFQPDCPDNPAAHFSNPSTPSSLLSLDPSAHNHQGFPNTHALMQMHMPSLPLATAHGGITTPWLGGGMGGYAPGGTIQAPDQCSDAGGSLLAAQINSRVFRSVSGFSSVSASTGAAYENSNGSLMGMGGSAYDVPFGVGMGVGVPPSLDTLGGGLCGPFGDGTMGGGFGGCAGGMNLNLSLGGSSASFGSFGCLPGALSLGGASEADSHSRSLSISQPSIPHGLTMTSHAEMPVSISVVGGTTGVTENATLSASTSTENDTPPFSADTREKNKDKVKEKAIKSHVGSASELLGASATTQASGGSLSLDGSPSCKEGEEDGRGRTDSVESDLKEEKEEASVCTVEPSLPIGKTQNTTTETDFLPSRPSHRISHRLSNQSTKTTVDRREYGKGTCQLSELEQDGEVTTEEEVKVENTEIEQIPNEGGTQEKDALATKLSAADADPLPVTARVVTVSPAEDE
uniref:Uncharacterized protein n=1 Tax=Chromera velia CCMP2878 TaxID=1169474 RepID=A0A0G4I2P1_9ALVE|eukprot:Cvel_10458.t1-p1 / transcript=Cvel_10458.t1 / gene=Cvel_10458 / organism=Chromera_velia_CCMP2878 / gene_product=hypothetical protein / transcript_product=hypothetical protein / location=Cvel_scaffold630:11648-16726(-) / protein_length=993 / sequence_SO=supercontig / SO=protein_coding / is_pseudo=false